MKNLLKSELYRLFHKKIMYIILLITIAQIWLHVLSFKLRLISGINYQTSNKAIGIFVDRLTSVQGIVCNMTPFLILVVIPIVSIMVVGNEKSLGNLRMVLTRPYKKGEVLESKLITITILNFLYLSIIFITTYLLSSVMMPYVKSTKILFQSYPLNFKESLIFNIKVYLLYFIQITFLSYIFSIVSTFIKNTVFAYIINIILLGGVIYLFKDLRLYIISPLNYIYDILCKNVSTNILFIEIIGSIMILIFLYLAWNELDFIE